jgi:preprotein translocase subunit YajC
VQFLIVIVVLLALMWLLMIRPQRKRQLEQQQRLEQLEPGQEILTAGGLYATVVSVEDDEVTVELSPGLRARVAKKAVAAVLTPDEEEHEADAEELEDAAELEEPDEEPEDEPEDEPGEIAAEADSASQTRS